MSDAGRATGRDHEASEPGPVYDRIGRGYAASRGGDPRIAAAVERALGGACSVVNLGAGTGSYEPSQARVLAVEPSLEMIRQRPPGAAPAVQAVAEALPLRAAAFDAALAVLTVHHWTDVGVALGEACRVARRRVVVVTWDPAARNAFWLTACYLPEIADFDVGRFPPIAAIRQRFPRSLVRPLPIAHDCRDGFLGAFWRRPAAYLDPAVRAGMSGFAQLPPGAADRGLARLDEDLRSGRWHARFGALCGAELADLGYRIVVGLPAPGAKRLITPRPAPTLAGGPTTTKGGRKHGD